MIPHPAVAYDDEAARRDLRWLAVVGAVRSHEEMDGSFAVVVADRRQHTLSVADVRAFRIGVLTGWRLPRGEAP